MSTQKLDMVVVGWKCPYEDGKKYEKTIGQGADFYENIVEDKMGFDYYHIKKNDLFKLFCFFDGNNGDFIIWGVVLAAQMDQGDVTDYEPTVWNEKDLNHKKELAKVQMEKIPECIRPTGEPELIIFTQYH